VTLFVAACGSSGASGPIAFLQDGGAAGETGRPPLDGSRARNDVGTPTREGGNDGTRGVADAVTTDALSASDAGAHLDAPVSTDAFGKPDAHAAFDAGGCASAACSDTAEVPPGWQPTLYTTSATTCPAGFAAPAQVSADTVLHDGACTCTATAPMPPTCEYGFLAMTYGTGCASGPASVAIVSDGACEALAPGDSLPRYVEIPLLPPSGGSCTSSFGRDASQLSSTAATLCAPTACPGLVCEGIAPTGYLACIETGGDVACPAGSEFATKHVVGDAPSLDCGACPACIASATCADGVVSFFSGASCGVAAIDTTIADGTCRGTTNFGTAFGAVTYTATVLDATYDPGTSTASFTQSGQNTVCCQ